MTAPEPWLDIYGALDGVAIGFRYPETGAVETLAVFPSSTLAFEAYRAALRLTEPYAPANQAAA